MSSFIYADKLKSWFKRFKTYKVTYKNGFFQLSNLSNSPETIVETFKNVPFCNYNPKIDLITSNTLFIKADLYFYNPEPGLWILLSDLHYKKNILMKNMFDKSLPVDHHFINLHYRKHSIDNNKSVLVKGFSLNDKTWAVFKAGHAGSEYHFKNSFEKNITIYFTSEWYNNSNLNSNQFFTQFLESTNTYILLDDANKQSDSFYPDLLNELDSESKNKHEIINLVKNLFNYFNRCLIKSQYNGENSNITEKDRRYLQIAENILKENVLNGFPGIEFISKKVGVSPTKLKSDFKVIYNSSVYKHYSKLQMILAKRIIKSKKYNIKETATLLGYTNASKFASAFRDYHGKLPSDFI